VTPPTEAAYGSVALYEPHAVQRMIKPWTCPASACSRTASQRPHVYSTEWSLALRTGGASSTCPVAGAVITLSLILRSVIFAPFQAGARPVSQPPMPVIPQPVIRRAYAEY